MKERLNTPMARLKRVRLLRLAVSPYKNYKIKCLYKSYLDSVDHHRLVQLKGTHKNERCFVIGNGSSLLPEDLEMLKGEFTFASNRIYEIFDQTSWRPTVYLTWDPAFFKPEHAIVARIPCKLKVLPYHWYMKYAELQKELDENALLIWVGPKEFVVKTTAPWAERTANIPQDISLGFSLAPTITYGAIQLAIHMGFREIYLLGVDFNYSRVIDENGIIRNADGVTTYFTHKEYDTTLLYYTPVKHAYESAREYCDAHGIKIRNATRGGKLEVFEREDLDELI